MSTILFLASARSDGNTKMICDFLSERLNAPILDFNDYDLDYYSYGPDRRTDDFIPLMKEILNYDTILFATPVYWYTMSAQMKTFLDRISDLLQGHKDLGRQLRGKGMKVICCSSDAEEFPEFWKPFERSAEYLGMKYQGNVHCWIENEQIPEEVKEQLMQL